MMISLIRALARSAHASTRPSVVLAALIVLPGALPAQERVHLNPVIAKLEAGEVVYGLSTQNRARTG